MLKNTFIISLLLLLNPFLAQGLNEKVNLESLSVNFQSSLSDQNSMLASNDGPESTKLNQSAVDSAKQLISKIELWQEPDFTLSQQLIEIVTRNKLKDYYEEASKSYFSGLSGNFFDTEIKESLYKELAYLEPIIGAKERKKLDELVSNSDPEIFRYLTQFWENKSLSPSDDYNERLLEHWERVNYVSENFNTNQREKFDDRGEIYLRFGDPVKKRNGYLMYNPAFASFILSTRMQDGRGGESSPVESSNNTTSYLNTLYRVREYHQYPAYEIWLYEDLSTSEDRVIYLFGNNFGGQEMELKRSVDDFIPSAAYSMTNRNIAGNMSIGQSISGGAGGSDDNSNSEESRERERTSLAFESNQDVGQSEVVSPAVVLQLMYYRQLASLDIFFSSQYDQMMNRYMDVSTPMSRSLARQFQQTNTAKLLTIQAKAPEENSSNSNFIYDLAPDAYSYQFYDSDNNPYYRVYFTGKSEEAITFDGLKKGSGLGSISPSNYELIHTVRSMTGEIDISHSVTKESEIAELQSENTFSNYIDVPTTLADNTIKVYSELHRKLGEEETNIDQNSTLKTSLVGAGSSKVDIEPTEAKEDLFSSDIIVGYHRGGDESFTDFLVSHDRIIPRGKNLIIYYEAYNIPLDTDGYYRYNLTSKISKDRNFLGKLFQFRKDNENSITINNASESSRFTQLLEIQSAEFVEGEYILEIELSNPNSEEVLHRKEIKLTIEQ
ncbi:MAG: hypothetical protein CL670_07105 [Balneola sp.]|jgi:GWxTD domain-containing protein|nr:hypothetical protein [Balneola sp.]MBE78903.1 hypothetical protein [Balneola sp.]|tara:strand:- start:31 stop:2196 length:2166 start_codon:yes stop_codon:yes gene_type:complete